MMRIRGRCSLTKKAAAILLALMLFATVDKMQFSVFAADYDISENVLSGAVSATVSADSNNDTIRDEIGRALIDGARESASGGGKTKWFLSDYIITNKLATGAYAEFELSDPVSVYEITVYSKTNTSTIKPISGFVLQSSMDGQEWSDVTEVKGNTQNLCTKTFDVVRGKYFRVVQKSENEFRVTEIQLKKAYDKTELKNEINGNDIFNTGRFVNTVISDVDDSFKPKLKIVINDVAYNAVKSSDGWTIDCEVPQSESGYKIDIALTSDEYNIKLWESSGNYKVYNYKDVMLK